MEELEFLKGAVNIYETKTNKAWYFCFWENKILYMLLIVEIGGMKGGLILFL